MADPYRQLDVIDSRAPRFNQATVGVLAALAVATGWWWVLAALAAQLAVGLLFGRRFCLPCLVYFGLVQPLLGEGRLEDARPPRFANLVGATFLAAAAIAYAVGSTIAGAALGSLVAALALLAASTGFCAGCEAYKLGSFLLGRPFVSCPIPGASGRSSRGSLTELQIGDSAILASPPDSRRRFARGVHGDREVRDLSRNPLRAERRSS